MRQLALVLVLLSILQASIYSGGGIDMTQGSPTTKTLYPIYLSLFDWQTIGYGGGLNTIPSLTTVPFNILYTLVLFLTNNGIANIYSNSLVLSLGAVGMLYLTAELLGDTFSEERKTINDERWIPAIAFFTALFALLYNEPESIYAAMAFLPLTSLFLYRIFRELNTAGRYKATTFFAFVILLALLIGQANDNYGTGLFVFMCVVCMMLLALGRSGTRLVLLQALIGSVVIGLLLNFNFVSVTYLDLMQIGNEYFNSYVLHGLGTYQLPYELIGFNPLLYNGLTTDVPIIPIAMLAVAMVGLYNVAKRIRLSAGPRPAPLFVLSLAAAYFATMFMASTVSPPFGPVFSAMLAALPLLLTIRTTFLVLFPFFALPALVMFAFGVYYALHQLSNFRNKIAVPAAAFVLVLLLAFYVYMYDYIPSSMPSYAVSVPQYVYNISNYFISMNGDFNIGTLPPALYYQTTTWYTGINVYSDLIYDHSVFTGGYAAYSGQFTPPIQSHGYLETANMISASNNIRGISISNLLGIYGIKYILIQGDASPSRDTYTNINSAGGITFVDRINGSDIYLNANAVPLVYGTGIANIGGGGLNATLAYVGNPSFNISAVSVYAGSVLGGCFPDQYSTCIGNLYIAGNFSPLSDPNRGPRLRINYTQNNPTSLTVQVRNATRPFYLVLRETYDSDWTAYYPNGTQVNDQYHIAVNGFDNAWYINRTGTYTMTIYNKLENIAIFSWLVTLVGIAAVAWLGVKTLGEKGAKK